METWNDMSTLQITEDANRREWDKRVLMLCCEQRRIKLEENKEQYKLRQILVLGFVYYYVNE